MFEMMFLLSYSSLFRLPSQRWLLPCIGALACLFPKPCADKLALLTMILVSMCSFPAPMYFIPNCRSFWCKKRLCSFHRRPSLLTIPNIITGSNYFKCWISVAVTLYMVLGISMRGYRGNQIHMIFLATVSEQGILIICKFYNKHTLYF